MIFSRVVQGQEEEPDVTRTKHYLLKVQQFIYDSK